MHNNFTERQSDEALQRDGGWLVQRPLADVEFGTFESDIVTFMSLKPEKCCIYQVEALRRLLPTRYIDHIAVFSFPSPSTRSSRACNIRTEV